MENWVFLLFIYFIPAVLCGELAFRHSANRLTYDAAVKYCKLQGRYFLPDDVTNSTLLVKYMNSQGITSVWVALKKKKLDGWRWTDSAPGGRQLSGMGLPDRVCAGVSTVDQTLRAMRCNYGGDYEGFICEKQGDSSCDGTSAREYCFSFRNSSFIFQCGINDWYTAEVRCRKKGRVLAALDSSDKIKEFGSEKNKHPALSMCSFYWVGLRKEDWIAVDSEENIRHIVESQWGYEQPQDGKGCCMASPVGRRIEWTTKQCNQVVSTVCVKQPDKSLPSELGNTKTNTTTNTPAEKSNLADESTSSITQQSWFIPVLVGAGVFLVLVLFATMLYLRRKKRNKGRNHMGPCAEKKGEQTIEDQSPSPDTQVTCEEAPRKPTPSNVEQGTEEERRQLIEAGSTSPVTKSRDNDTNRSTRIEDSHAKPSSGPVHADESKSETHDSLKPVSRTTQPGDSHAKPSSGPVHADESNSETNVSLKPASRTSQPGDSHAKPNSGHVHADDSNSEPNDSLEPISSITAPAVQSEGKQLADPQGITENTTRNCETLGEKLGFGKPILIGMVISSDQELHMNKYLGENSSSRSDIESTMQSVMSDFYKGILGWRSEESLEPRKLRFMNMLNTTRFVDESNTFYSKIKEVPLDIIQLETYEKNRYTGKSESFLKLKDEHVIITTARKAKDGIIDDAINVGVISNASGNWCAYGYNPDFLVYTDYYKHRLYLGTEEEPDPQEVATIYTTVVASLVIMLVKDRVWEILKQPKLKSTAVMREILIRMCSHPHQKTDGEGFGVLDPWPFLLNWNKMKAVLNEVVK